MVQAVTKFYYQIQPTRMIAKMQQHIKIRNQPMRTPSPDYACKNRSCNASTPFDTISKTIFLQQGALPAKLPIIPLDIIKRKNVKSIENMQSSRAISSRQGQRQKHETKNGSANSTSFKIFDSQVESNQIYNRVKQIYLIVAEPQLINGSPTGNYEEKELTQFAKCLRRLQIIKQKINQIINNQNKSKSKSHFQSFGNEEQLEQENHIKQSVPLKKQKQEKQCENKQQNSIFDSPIRKSVHLEEESQISLFQTYQQNENKYKRQLSHIKVQLQKMNIIGEYGPISQQNSSISLSKNQRTEIQTLKTLSSEKGLRALSSLNYNEQLSIISVSQPFLKQKIAYLQNELSNKIKKLQLLEKQRYQGQSSQKQKLPLANLKIVNNVVAIEEKLNTNLSYSIKNQVVKQEQNIDGSKSIQKWQEKIIKLQKAVHEIKKQILSYDIENDTHQQPVITCKCVQIIANKIDCIQHQKQIKFLRTQIQQAKMQNEKLKNLCTKIEHTSNENIEGGFKVEKKGSKRRKGIQKVPKNKLQKSQYESDAFLSESVLSELLSKSSSAYEIFNQDIESEPAFINNSNVGDSGI